MKLLALLQKVLAYAKAHPELIDLILDWFNPTVTTFGCGSDNESVPSELAEIESELVELKCHCDDEECEE